MPGTALNVLVFRPAKQPTRGSRLRSGLTQHLVQVAELRHIRSPAVEDQRLAALLAAGELECAVADAGENVDALQGITDALAESLLSSQPLSTDAGLSLLARASIPEHLTISTPEGFAYYGLHPSCFARALDNLA